MPDTIKILGQQAPSATTETTLYTVPASTSTVISTILVCNRGGSSTTFRISTSASGGATANKDYIYYDLPIGSNDTFVATMGVSLATTDVVRVYAGSANLSFSAYGVEIT
jgi:hypothetical protein